MQDSETFELWMSFSLYSNVLKNNNMAVAVSKEIIGKFSVALSSTFPVMIATV